MITVHKISDIGRFEIALPTEGILSVAQARAEFYPMARAVIIFADTELPVSETVEEVNTIIQIEEERKAMLEKSASLRDQLAMAVITGIYANPVTMQGLSEAVSVKGSFLEGKEPYELASAMAYVQADDMLKVRKS